MFSRGFVPVTIVLSVMGVGCSDPPLKAREVKGAPRSPEQAGYLVWGVSLNEIEVRLGSRGFRWRDLNSKHHLYELYGLSREDILSALPSVQVIKNKVLKIQNKVVSDRDRPFDSEKIPVTQSNSPDSNNGLITRSDFLRCYGTPESQSPRPSIFVLDSKKSVVYSAFGPVLTMGHSLRLTGVKSLPSPLASDGSKMKKAWFYEPPWGSKIKPMVYQGDVMDLTTDTVGEHHLNLLVEDDRGACAQVSVTFLSTTNPPYKVPNDDLTTLLGLGENFSMEKFTHLDRVRARESWEYSQGEGVTIAILDSGVNYLHPAVAHNIKTNEGEIPGNGIDDDSNGKIDDYIGFDYFFNDPYPFDDESHGSHVAGLAASSLIGLAKKAKILPIKIGAFSQFDIGSATAGIFYAVDSGAKVINLSFASAENHEFQEKAIQYARDAGVVIVAASGNGDPLLGLPMNIDDFPIFPASYSTSNIITVAASGGQRPLASYSNYGVQTVDVVAPGGDRYLEELEMVPDLVYSLSAYNPEGRMFEGRVGTSMAAPIVSGLVAQILSINSDLKPREVIKIIMSTGDTDPGLVGKVRSGSHINALKAVLKAQETLLPAARRRPHSP